MPPLGSGTDGSQRQSTKVFVIGLDGASFDFMEPWLQEGSLPHLAGLLRRGAAGPLRSTFVPHTSQAWPSLITGRNPGKHGYFDFSYRSSDSYERRQTVNLGLSGWPLQRYLSHLGRRVAMINVPMTYRPTPVNGVLISGFQTPEGVDDWAWPPDLPAELVDAGVPYPMQELHDQMRIGKQGRADPDMWRWVAGWRDVTEAQLDVLSHLLESSSFDFAMMVFTCTDHINHRSAELGPIEEIYRIVDRAIGRILSLLDDETVVLVVSDHGSARVERFLVLHRLLSDLGLIGFRREVSAHFLRTATGRFAWPVRHRVTSAWSALPRPLRQAISLPLLAADRRLRYGYENIDWRRTRVYSIGSADRLFVNLRGREPQGIVEPGEEYEAIRDRLIGALEELRDPESNEPVVERAARCEEVYHGPLLSRAPDVIFALRDRRYLPVNGFASDPLLRPARKRDGRASNYGYHTAEGILVAAGPGIRGGVEVESADVHDVAPTVLHMLGLEVPDDVDGRVLQELFTSPRPVSRIAVEPEPEVSSGRGRSELTPQEEEEMRQRLRGLGYLE